MNAVDALDVLHVVLLDVAYRAVLVRKPLLQRIPLPQPNFAADLFIRGCSHLASHTHLRE